jgi:uncharacterized protein YdhG (YjbR/CyaY superfamily)
MMGTKKGKPGSVDEYIAQFSEDVQKILNAIRVVIKEEAPEAEEKISYGMAGYFQNGGLIWYGAYKQHIGFYPLTDAMLAQIEGLSAYKGAKSSIHFKLDRSMPYDLIRQMVRVRLAENSSK